MKQRFEYVEVVENVDWQELSDLYRLAPLGEKLPDDLRVAFQNSMFVVFVYDQRRLVGVGRAMADGVDCAYICDVAVHPDYQGAGVGKGVIERLLERSAGHRKILLYAAPGKERFYQKLGFFPMNTAMAIFQNQEQALNAGVIRVRDAMD